MANFGTGLQTLQCCTCGILRAAELWLNDYVSRYVCSIYPACLQAHPMTNWLLMSAYKKLLKVITYSFCFCHPPPPPPSLSLSLAYQPSSFIWDILYQHLQFLCFAYNTRKTCVCESHLLFKIYTGNCCESSQMENQPGSTMHDEQIATQSHLSSKWWWHWKNMFSSSATKAIRPAWLCLGL